MICFDSLLTALALVGQTQGEGLSQFLNGISAMIAGNSGIHLEAALAVCRARTTR